VTSEKSNPALHVTIAIASAFLFAGAARANCLEAWPPDMKTRPDFSCVPLTDRLLASLEGATKAEVIKGMRAIGRPLGPNEKDVLHFVSVADRYSGDINFEIKDDSGENGSILSYLEPKLSRPGRKPVLRPTG
jgi:hypothetical protein